MTATALSEERAMQRKTEEHRSAEAFFSAEMTKNLGRQMDVAIMWIDFDEIDVPNPPYHKSVSQQIVDEMFKEFNPVVAGFLVANIRDNGKTALIDGRHRRAMAIKKGEKGWWFIVTHGLSLDEEAKLFRWFQARKNMNTAEKLNALIIEGDPQAIALRGAVTSQGCALPFEDDKKRHQVNAVEALIHIFQRGGPDAVKRVLGLAVGSWMGAPASFASTLLKGIWVFISNDEVKSKLDWDIFRDMLKSHSADNLNQRGKLVATQERCPTPYGIASILRLEYNRKARGQRRLDHDFAHAPRKGIKRPNVVLRGVKRGMPEVPEHVREEVDYRVDRHASGQFRGGRPVSAALRALVEAAVDDGYEYDKIREAFGVSELTIAQARKEIAKRMAKMARSSKNGRRRG